MFFGHFESGIWPSGTNCPKPDSELEGDFSTGIRIERIAKVLVVIVGVVLTFPPQHEEKRKQSRAKQAADYADDA
jgi:hypothetical protein